MQPGKYYAAISAADRQTFCQVWSSAYLEELIAFVSALHQSLGDPGHHHVLETPFRALSVASISPLVSSKEYGENMPRNGARRWRESERDQTHCRHGKIHVQLYNMPERSFRRFRRSNWCHLWMDAITHTMTPCFFGGEALKVYKGHAAAVDLLEPRGMTWGERG